MKQLLRRSAALPAPSREPRKARLIARELRLRSGEKRLNQVFGAARTCRKHAAQLSGAVCPKAFLIFWAFVRTGERPMPVSGVQGVQGPAQHLQQVKSCACRRVQGPTICRKYALVFGALRPPARRSEPAEKRPAPAQNAAAVRRRVQGRAFLSALLPSFNPLRCAGAYKAEPCANGAQLARLRAEMYFLRRTCRRRKWLKLYLRLRAQTLRGFYSHNGPPSGGPL